MKAFIPNLYFLFFLITSTFTATLTNQTTSSITTLIDLPLLLFDSQAGYLKNMIPQLLGIVNKQVPIPNHRLTVPSFCVTNDIGSMNRCFLNSIERGDLGMMGIGFSTQALLIGMTSTTFTQPWVTFASSSPSLTQSRDYPYLFRTCPNGIQQAYTMIRLCAHYKWRDISILASNSEFALSLTKYAGEAAVANGINVKNVNYFTEIIGDLHKPLLRIRDSGVRIIIIAATPVEMIRIMYTANELEMTGKPYIYISSQITRDDINIPGTANVNQTTADLLSGSFCVSKPRPDYKAEIIRQIYPSATASQNESTSNAPYLLNALYSFAHAFRSLVLDGHQSTDQLRGENLVKALFRVRYQDPTLSEPTPYYYNSSGETYSDRFAIYNFQPTGDRLQIGLYANGVTRFDDDATVLWPKGYGPNEKPDATPVTNITYYSCEQKGYRTDTRGLVVVESPTEPDPQSLPTEVKCNDVIDCANWSDESDCSPTIRTAFIVIGIFVGLGIIFLVSSLVLILLFFRRPRIRAAGCVFLMLACCSSITGIISVFFTFGKPNPYVCMCFYWFLVLSASILMGSLLARQYRVWKVFGNKNITPVAFTEWKLFVFSTLITIPDFVVLLFWSIFDLPTLRTDSDNNVRCESDLYILYYILILSMKAIVAIGSLVLAILSRKFPSAFSDARLIGFSIYNECLIGVISIPLVLSLRESNVYIEWVIQALAIMAFFLTTFGIMMIPKIYGLIFIDGRSSSTGSHSFKNILTKSTGATKDKSVNKSAN